MANWKSKFRRKRIVLAFLSVVSVLVLTHLPPDAIPKALPSVLQVGGSDKIEHGVAYALVTMSFLLAVNWQTDRRLWVIIILGIAVVGAADEITQQFVNRDCSGWDWVADLAGIAAGCVVALLNCRRGRAAGTPKGHADSIEPGAAVPPIRPKPVLLVAAGPSSQDHRDRIARVDLVGPICTSRLVIMGICMGSGSSGHRHEMEIAMRMTFRRLLREE